MRLERYAVGETIARSGRTIVRRARRVADGLAVVIKTPAREYPTVRDLSQLEFEHRILGKLAMPGVVTAIELERESRAGWRSCWRTSAANRSRRGR